MAIEWFTRIDTNNRDGGVENLAYGTDGVIANHLHAIATCNVLKRKQRQAAQIELNIFFSLNTLNLGNVQDLFARLNLGLEVGIYFGQNPTDPTKIYPAHFRFISENNKLPQKVFKDGGK